ncbi:MAG: SCO family protein [Hyphomicrobiaceae bacterium]|nr:SCO family protein [Hyphomicrobiaceae bacterium]
MKRIRIAAWISVAAVLMIAGVAYLLRSNPGLLSAQMPLSASIGGPFELTTQDGKRLSSGDLKGTPFALFFGFTHCPDVCPTTMLELSNVIKEMGPDADRMRFFFVSVDTERDTPDLLKLYLSNFDPRITGLVGTPAELAAVAKAYRAFYEKVSSKDGFTYNHTALVYLMDGDGHLAGTLNYQEPETVQVKKLRRLVGQTPS